MMVMSFRHRLCRVLSLVTLCGVVFGTPIFANADDCEGPKALALINGNIHTMDAKNTVVSSVLIGNGKFLAVNNDDYAEGPCTDVIDLKGKTAVPGLIDNHNHIILLGLRPGHDVRLDKANSIQDVLDIIAAKVATVKNGEWVVSLGGFHINQFGEDPPRFPTLAELNSVAPKNPVLLYLSFAGPSQTNSMGKAFFESKGIEVGGDGSIGNGFGPGSPSLTALHELRSLPEHNNLEAKKQGLLDALNFGAFVGLTTHVDQGSFHYVDSYFGNPGTPDDFFASVLASFDQYRAFDAARALHLENALTARIQINYLHQDTEVDTPTLRQRLLNTVPFLGDMWLSNGGIGEFTSRDPFSGSADVGPVGQTATRLVAQHGWRNENHSLSSTDFMDVLDMWEQINTELKTTGIPQTPSDPDPTKDNVINKNGITKLRWVLAHVPFITNQYINKAKQLEVGLSLLGWRWLTGTPSSNGPPFRTILRLGARAGMSSDGMQINVMDPWTNIYYAVTGKNARGVLINGNETISREEVLRLYTVDNAWFLGPHWEKNVGTIEKGKWADVVVLSANFFDEQEVPDDQIRSIHSVLTIVNGKTVHDTLNGG